ncbi:hypothetical protein DFH09DRAFT_1110412 [Mycena vulgaris]|nr:hypothetical protein DFH09DRAFT_1110412 [Mycena vulgaris]
MFAPIDAAPALRHAPDALDRLPRPPQDPALRYPRATVFGNGRVFGGGCEDRKAGGCGVRRRRVWRRAGRLGAAALSSGVAAAASLRLRIAVVSRPRRRCAAVAGRGVEAGRWRSLWASLRLAVAAGR